MTGPAPGRVIDKTWEPKTWEVITTQSPGWVTVVAPTSEVARQMVQGDVIAVRPAGSGRVAKASGLMDPATGRVTRRPGRWRYQPPTPSVRQGGGGHTPTPSAAQGRGPVGRCPQHHPPTRPPCVGQGAGPIAAADPPAAGSPVTGRDRPLTPAGPSNRSPRGGRASVLRRHAPDGPELCNRHGVLTYGPAAGGFRAHPGVTTPTRGVQRDTERCRGWRGYTRVSSPRRVTAPPAGRSFCWSGPSFTGGRPAGCHRLSGNRPVPAPRGASEMPSQPVDPRRDLYSRISATLTNLDDIVQRVEMGSLKVKHAP